MKRRILLIGFGSHGRVVLDLFRQAGRLDEIGGFIDAYEEQVPAAAKVEGVKVLGGLSFIERARSEGHESFLVPVGDNRLRQELTRRAVAAGLVPATIAAPSAVVGTPAQIGPGTMISAGAHIVTGSILGTGVLVNTAATIDHDNRIGDFVHVAPGAHLGGKVEIGERSMVGIGAAVIQGVRVGKDVTIGAGAAVISDLPDGVTAVGVPARILARAVLAAVLLVPAAASAEGGSSGNARLREPAAPELAAVEGRSAGPDGLGAAIRLAPEPGSTGLAIELARDLGEADLMDACLESPVEEAWVLFERGGRPFWLDVGDDEKCDFVRVRIPWSKLAGIRAIDVYHMHPLRAELDRAARYYRPLAHGTVDEYRRRILDNTPGLYARPPGRADYEAAVTLAREAAARDVAIAHRVVVAEGVYAYGGLPGVPFPDVFDSLAAEGFARAGGLEEWTKRLLRFRLELSFDGRRRLADCPQFARLLERAIATRRD